MSVIGDRMKALRGGSSLREMADAIGIKYNAWARYESGEVLPGAAIIEKICRVHAVSADWLLGIDAKDPCSIHTSVKTPAIPDCSKCPFKRKLKRVEKALQDD